MTKEMIFKISEPLQEKIAQEYAEWVFHNRDFSLKKPEVNIYSPVIIKKGQGDTDGNPTIEIQFAGCISEMMGEMLTEREKECFKKGILAEQERTWDRLADILGKKVLDKIKYEELYNSIRLT